MEVDTLSQCLFHLYAWYTLLGNATGAHSTGSGWKVFEWMERERERERIFGSDVVETCYGHPKNPSLFFTQLNMEWFTKLRPDWQLQYIMLKRNILTHSFYSDSFVFNSTSVTALSLSGSQWIQNLMWV